MLRVTAASAVAGVLAQAAGQSSPSPFLTLAVALLGGGIATAIVNTWSRRRSGEDRGAAAQSVGIGASEIAKGAVLLEGPLNQRIGQLQQEVLDLTRKNAQLEGKIAQARRDTAVRAAEAADQEREILTIQREAERQHALDRAEVHDLTGKLGDAKVELQLAAIERDQLRETITSLQVKAGDLPDRRTE